MPRLPALSLVLLVPASLGAQFHIPLTPALSPDTVCAIKLREATRDVADGRKWQVASQDQCVAAQGPDSVRRIFDADPPRRRTIIRGPTLFSDDGGIRGLYGMKSLRFLGGFASTLTDDNAYLSTDVLSGILGRIHFDLTLAQVVSTGEDGGESAVQRDETRNATSNVMRLLGNGGSATIWLMMPVLATSGTFAQTTVATYAHGGALGPLGRSSDLVPDGGLGVEALTSMAIRHPASYDLQGELLVGARAGVDWVDGEIAPAASDRRSLPFLQATLGIRRGSSTLLSVLYTVVPSAHRDFVPRLQFMVAGGQS